MRLWWIISPTWDPPYPGGIAQLVLEGLAPLGEDFVAKLKEAYSGGWIDVYPNENKSSGAFSCGDLVRVHPYVLLNHNNNLTSAMTIAHELGHAMHSYFSNAHQPYPKADYSLFVAEVASTCNEALDAPPALQKKFTDPKAQAYLLVDLLEKFRTTVYRQTMFAEFERISHDMAAKGEPLTKDALNAAYYDLNQKYYGGGAVVDRLVENELDAHSPFLLSRVLCIRLCHGLLRGHGAEPADHAGGRKRRAGLPPLPQRRFQRAAPGGAEAGRRGHDQPRTGTQRTEDFPGNHRPVPGAERLRTHTKGEAAAMMKGYDREEALAFILSRINRDAHPVLRDQIDGLIAQAIDADMKYMHENGVLDADGNAGDCYYEDDEAFEYMVEALVDANTLTPSRP